MGYGERRRKIERRMEKGEERKRKGKRKTGTAPETMNRQAKVRRLTTVCI